MLKSSQSGHPGGSLSSIDYLATLYAYIISQTGEPVIVSNGHISPAVYAVLAELGYISKKDVIANFRKTGHPYEGHVTRHVPGIWYGTGPLGTGISAAAGFALAEQLHSSGKKVFGILGDGEAEEGQVYEMMNFAAKYRLDNFIAFMDYNRVQLSGSLAHIMPINPKKIFLASGWEVIEFNGHDFEAIWGAISRAYSVKNKPVLLLGKTIMGRGVNFMEKTGQAHQSDWHGKAPKPAEADLALKQLAISNEQLAMLQEFKKLIVWKPKKPVFTPAHAPMRIKPGTPKVYAADVVTDCRSAYGAALLDLARLNNNVLAMTADLADSVKTDGMRREFPLRHIECGIAEQHMVSAAGGISLDGFIPFASTFGAFMTSRAKDQARVNDINLTNVKMVATHCGLSVGEDGPTHQAIDDMGSMIGLLHTGVIEPADPNHCDRIIRYVASHFGNFYVRMGRHKIPVLTREDGSIFFDSSYEYHYGRCDILRSGSSLTIVATGATVSEALKARDILHSSHPGHSIEIVIASSIKHFDDTLTNSIRKTKKVVTVEDHNIYSGLGNQIARHIVDNQLSVDNVQMLGVRDYELSGTAEALYEAAGISAKQIATTIGHLLTV
jgi:transketolase